MRLSQETETQVRREIDRMRLFAAHYSRCALVARWRARREWFETQVARFDARARALTLALDFGGAR